MPMIQYQAANAGRGPSAIDLYTQSFRSGIPFEQLMAAHSAEQAGMRTRQKQDIDLAKSYEELRQTRTKNQQTELNPQGIRLKPGERFKRDGSGEVEPIPGSGLYNKQQADIQKAKTQQLDLMRMPIRLSPKWIRYLRPAIAGQGLKTRLAP